LLRVEHLKIGALPALSFAVAEGECLAVEGPSGSGKTRILRAIADLDPAEGQIFLDGAERREMLPTDWRKRVRFAAAEPGWWTDSARGTLPAVPGAEARLSRLIAAVGLDDAILDRPVAHLSTGERQRIALVRAVLDDPQVLLLDEPTGPLDVTASALVEELIRFQLLSGKTVLLASHDRAMVDRLAHARLELAPASRPFTPSKGALP